VSDFDVHADDMDIERPRPQLTDREVESILSGLVPAKREDIDALVAVIDTLRSTQIGPQPRADADLTAVFAYGLPEDCPPAPSWAIPPDPESAVRIASRQFRWKAMHAVTRLGAVLGTLAGKLMIGAAIAAASVGGAQATGVIDIPGLPDRVHTVGEAGERYRRPVTEATTPSEHRNHPLPQQANEASEQTQRAKPAQSEQPGNGGEVSDRARNGGEIADRAMSSEAQEDGQAFGLSVAAEASEGTFAEDTPGTSEDGQQAGTGNGGEKVPPGQAKEKEGRKDQKGKSNDAADGGEDE
jgi:hypothetical protein